MAFLSNVMQKKTIKSTSPVVPWRILSLVNNFQAPIEPGSVPFLAVHKNGIVNAVPYNTVFVAIFQGNTTVAFKASEVLVLFTYN